MHFADFGQRLCDIVKKCKHPCLSLSLVDVFKPYIIPLITLCLFMFSQGCILLQHDYFNYLSCHETISFGRRNTCSALQARSF